MMKKKIKLSLIDDYIKIMLIKQFYNNYSQLISASCQESTGKQALNLENTYNLIFKLLKMDDLSLDILKRQLQNNSKNFLLNSEKLKSILEKSKIEINSIEKNLPEKMSKLKINPNLKLLNLI